MLEVQQQNVFGGTPARSSLLILARLCVTVLGLCQSTHLSVIVNRVCKYTERNCSKREHGTMFYTLFFFFYDAQTFYLILDHMLIGITALYCMR